MGGSRESDEVIGEVFVSTHLVTPRAADNQVRGILINLRHNSMGTEPFVPSKERRLIHRKTTEILKGTEIVKQGSLDVGGIVSESTTVLQLFVRLNRKSSNQAEIRAGEGRRPERTLKF